MGVPPNEKEWTEDQRGLINDRLPGAMRLGDTYDIRVGQWFPVIEDERQQIIDTFESLGVDVRVPQSLAYRVEIENWTAQSEVENHNG